MLHPWLYPRLSAELNQHNRALKTFSWSLLQHNDGKQMPVCLSREGSLLNTQYVPNFSIFLSYLQLKLLIIARQQGELWLNKIFLSSSSHACCVSKTPDSIIYYLDSQKNRRPNACLSSHVSTGLPGMKRISTQTADLSSVPQSCIQCGLKPRLDSHWTSYKCLIINVSF